MKVLLFVAAVTVLVGCQMPVQSTDAHPAPGSATTATTTAPTAKSGPFDGTQKEIKAERSGQPKDDWQRTKDCAEQAYRIIKENPEPLRLGWENHYSPKYGLCFVDVSYSNPDAKKYKGAPYFFEELYDAFERRLLTICSRDMHISNDNPFCSIQTGPPPHFDCSACRAFIRERMEN